MNSSNLTHCKRYIILGIRSVSGLFQNGLPSGRVVVYFIDGETVEATAQNGILEGKVRQFTSDGRLIFVGLYANGRPHGPAWMISNNLDEEGAVLAHYSQGKLDSSVKVVHLGRTKARIGILNNQTYLLESQKLHIDKSGDIQCVKVRFETRCFCHG